MSTIKTSQLEGISSQLGAINVPLGTVLTVDGMLEFESTGGHKIPAGSNAQRPVNPVAGHIRFNTDSSSIELYNGSEWEDLGTGSLVPTVGDFTNPSKNGKDIKLAGRPSGYYWIRPVGYTESRLCYVDNDNYDGGWVCVQTVGSSSTRHWATIEAQNLYNGTVGGITTDYVPVSSTGYSTSDGRRWDDVFVRDLMSPPNGGDQIFNLRLSRNNAQPPGGVYDTYAGGTTNDWRYAAFVRFNGGCYYYSSTNTGGDDRQGDRNEGTFSVSHTYPYSWEQPGGWGHIRLASDAYKVFDFHSSPSSIQTSRYGTNRFLWGYTGANNGQGIYGGSDSFTGNNNTNPGYMFVR